jgi:hypothetical protein
MASDSSGEREEWKGAAEAREWLRGHKPSNPEAFRHSGLAGDATTRELLSTLADHYDPASCDRAMPPRVEETRLYRALLGRESTETVTRAIHQADAQTVSYAVGDPAARSDISGLRAVSSLTDMLTTPAPIFYLFGEPGSGKTNFGLLLAQLYQREHPDAELASNIRTWREADAWLPSYPQLEEWLDEQTRSVEGGGVTRREDANPRLFVFDEASSHASGRGKQGAEAGQKLGPLVYKIRKARCGLVIIGHDGRDVHPAVRTLATVVQRYRGELKRATVYEDVKNREGRGQIVELRGIPETDYRYDDGEATSWSWDSVDDDTDAELERAREMAEELHEEHRRELAARMAEAADAGWLDADQTEIGAVFGRKQSWVSKWKSRLSVDAPSDPRGADEDSEL